MMVGSFGDVDSGPWRISAGAGVRNIRTDFHVGTGGIADPLSFLGSQANGGDLSFASNNQDANYLDGGVFPATGATWTVFTPIGSTRYGTANFAVDDQSQVTNYGSIGVNRQGTVHSN